MSIGNIGSSGLCWGSQAHPNLPRSAPRVNRPWTQSNRIITHFLVPTRPAWEPMSGAPAPHTGGLMELSAVVTSAPEGGYIAFNPETGTTTQGKMVEEALANLREATGLGDYNSS